MAITSYIATRSLNIMIYTNEISYVNKRLLSLYLEYCNNKINYKKLYKKNIDTARY